MPEEQLDDDLACLQLPGQTLQANFVGIGGRTDGQLVPELLGELLLELQYRLIVELIGTLRNDTQG